MDSRKVKLQALTTVRLLVAATFLYAGFAKAASPAAFSLDILNYRLLPPDASLLTGIYLPWLEICVGLAILGRKLYMGALAIAGILLAVFIAALGSAAIRGLDISCGCFGAHGTAGTYRADIARDILLVAGVVVLSRFDRPGPVEKKG